MKHTQGPWKAAIEFGIDTSNNKCKVFAAKDSFFVIIDGTKSNEESVANARLIAAAPDLLRELTEILELFETKNLKSESKSLDSIITQNLKDVIKKAKGE